MTRYVTRIGQKMKVGGRSYRWYVRNKARLSGIVPRRVTDPRAKIVAIATWGVAHEPSIHYSEAAIRSQAITQGFGKLPLTTDCSGFATYCYKHAGLPDPNGFAYKELGYTGTLLARAKETLTDVSKALPGDLIVYGPGTGAHVAVIVEAGKDPMTISHGEESGPEYVRVSQDGRMPQRICRYL